MKKTGIMTDSHSGILENEASKLGTAVLPMPFYIDEKLYREGVDIVHYDSENHYIEMTIPISDPDDKSETVIGVMLISVSTDNIVINQSYMRQVAVIVMVMVGIAIVFFAILLLLYFLKPLQKIAIDRIRQHLHGCQRCL